MRAAFLHLLVAPGVRRRGIGSVLLDQVLRRACELDVQALRGSYATAAGAAFAAHFGAVAETRVVRSVLDLPGAELPEPRVPTGFRLLTWLGCVPDEPLPAYVDARAAMDDARRRREMRLSVAMDNDGAIGSFTELRVSRGSVLGFTDDTGTVAARRGLGLARAVKLESLHRLRTDHPEISVVSTSNAEENSAMRRLNESLGFRATAVVTSGVLKLARSQCRETSREPVSAEPRGQASCFWFPGSLCPRHVVRHGGDVPYRGGTRPQ